MFSVFLEFFGAVSDWDRVLDSCWMMILYTWTGLLIRRDDQAKMLGMQPWSYRCSQNAPELTVNFFSQFI